MIIPAKYQHLDLTSDEKNLLRKLEKQLRVEDILVLQVNPFGEVDSRFFSFILDNGVILLRVDPFADEHTFPVLAGSLFKLKHDKYCEALGIRFLDHPLLCNNNNDLKFPVTVLYYFPKLSFQKLTRSRSILALSDETKQWMNIMLPWAETQNEKK